MTEADMTVVERISLTQKLPRLRRVTNGWLVVAVYRYRSLAQLPNCEMPRSLPLAFCPKFPSLSGCETKGARIDKLWGLGRSLSHGNVGMFVLDIVCIFSS